jgi:hypothetical protein
MWNWGKTNEKPNPTKGVPILVNIASQKKKSARIDQKTWEGGSRRFFEI